MKKRIFIVGPGMELGGVERSLLGLLDCIDYERFDVDLFLLAHTGELMPFINPKVNLLPEEKEFALINLPIKELILQKHFVIAAIRLLSKFLGDCIAKLTKTQTLNIVFCKRWIAKRRKTFEKEYDIALGFFEPHYLVEKKVKAKVKIGWVHTDYASANELPNTKITLSMWKGLDYIACVSEQVKESFDRIYPSLKKKTIVIENVLSADFVRSQAQAFDAQEEIPTFEGTNILSVGRFTYQKNFENIPPVCKILKEKGVPVRWYLIGYGNDEALIRSKIAEEGMEETVIILGKKTNPYPYMKACDIYAQPSRYEGKAVTVREAQMLQKPVLITNYGTAGSQVNDGVDGYICELSNEGIAQGIEYLIENSEIRERFVKNTSTTNYSNMEEFLKIVALMEK